MTGPNIPGIDRAVRAARLDLAFNGLPMSLVTSAALGAITVAVLRGSQSPLLLGFWYAASLGVAVGRYLLYCRYRAHRAAGTLGDLDRWGQRFFGGAFAAGSAWGALCLALFPTHIELQVFVAFVLAGTAAGAVTSLSAEPRAALAFILPSVVPLAVRLLALDTATGLAMGAMIALFILMVASSLRRSYRQLVDSVAARLQSDLHLEELSKAQHTMRALNDRLTIATQAGKVGVWEWNLLAETVLWDPQLYCMYDVDPASGPINYQTWRNRIHPQDIARVESALHAAMEGSERFETEFRVLLSDGTERTLLGAAIVQYDGTGKAVSMIGMNSDITELKRVDRMKSEFVSIVSHELRTPLTSIRGSLGLVGSGVIGAIPEKVRQLIVLANRNAERLAVLIDDILDMEKIESGRLRFELQRQALLPLIEQSLAANAAYASLHKVSLTLQEPAWPATVAVDANRLLQVLANLISNAVKFSPPDSHVEIAVQPFEARVRIEVRDRGQGIAAEFHSKIFGKFCQGDSSDARAKGGSGLGLAISKAIVQQMGGSIDFRTAAGAGTTFFFDLPVCQDGDAPDPERTTIVLPLELA